MTPWWIALQFLTRLPVTLAGMPTPEQVGRSLLFYPLVGLLIGLLLLAAQHLLGDSAVLLQAAFVFGLAELEWAGARRAQGLAMA